MSPCCGRLFQCRLCHDEAIADHAFDRFQVTTVVCKRCDEAQPPAKDCRSCGVPFGGYACLDCRLWKADDARGTYHCDGCGLCRVGKREDYQHCDSCCMCLPVATFEEHLATCREQMYRSNCPVCSEDLFTSREGVASMRCGHVIHPSCLRALISAAFSADDFPLAVPRCPLCKKSVESMEAQWEAVAEQIRLQPMPAPGTLEGVPEFVAVACHDCEAETPRAPFHFLGMRCGACGSFNTAQVKGSSAAAEEGSEAGAGGGGDHDGEDDEEEEDDDEQDDGDDESAESAARREIDEDGRTEDRGSG